MTRSTLAIIAVFASILATAETNRTATENWTRNRIAAATNGLATVSDVELKADKATTLAGYGITDAVPLVEDVNSNKTAVTIGSRKGIVGPYSLANGNNVTASGQGSHAEGGYTHAEGGYTHAEGDSTHADGYGTHAEGIYTHAEGSYTHAEGDYTHAEGYYTHAEGDSTHADGYGTHAEGSYTHAEGYYTHAEGDSTHADGYGTHAEGIYTHASTFASKAAGINSQATNRTSFVWQGTDIGDDSYIDHDSVPLYGSHGAGTFNINPVGGAGGFYIGEQTLSDVIFVSITNNISAENPTFSNAVLAVGLNIDTNSVAVLNEIAETFGGFPIEGTATTVGGLLAALAAAAAWLKKNKVGSFASVGGASATVENGVAKLDDFFTESNSLLTATIDARLPYPINAVPSTGLLKDLAINTTSLASVTVPDNFTDLLVRASVASSLSVTMPEATTKYGDTFPGEAGEYLITITKTGAAEAYVRTIKLEEVA